jgi:ADP-ribose pyrophosphatase YjhB (NUDIX family)
MQTNERRILTMRVLLFVEFGDQGFWLPGGAVNPGESFTVAARRKYLEQAGVDIELKGAQRFTISTLCFMC